jgi:uncharacterized repeat protein (TIGR01451 family)
VAQDVTCTLTGSLAATATSTITLSVTVSPSYTGGPFSNTASVTAGTPDPDPSNNSATDITGTITPLADVAITKTHTGDFTAGTDGAYTITVDNIGPSDAAGPVTVTDTLPAGETFVSAAGTGWTCGDAGQTVTCTLAAGLAAGTTAPAILLTVSVDSSVTAVLDNTAIVDSPTSDPVPGNNSATDPTTVVTSADLSLVKSDSGHFAPGGDGTYTIAISNAGPSDAAGPLTVTDTLPAGETFVSGTGTGWTCTATGQAVTCTSTSDLTTGSATNVTLTVALGAAAYPSVVNTATVSSPTPDPTPGNNTGSDTTPVAAVADLSIVKSHTATVVAGNQLTYTLAVANAGPTPDPGPVTVADALPAGETFVSAVGTGWTCNASGQTVTCVLPGPYPVGQQSSIALTVLLGAAAVPTVTNTATVAGTGTDPVPANNTSSDPTTVGPGVNLSVTKTLVGTTLTTGTNASWLITVHNAGPSPASGVTATDALPAGLSPVSASGDGWTCQVAAVIHCAYGPDLPAGSDATVTVVTLVTATTGAIANGAVVGSSTAELNTSTNVTTTPAMTVAAPPTPPIAMTGIYVDRLLELAGLLIAVGLLLLALARRRRPAKVDAAS